MEILKVSIVGASPLMMHSDRLANPLLPETKAHKQLTAKRKKTDDDHMAIAHSEFISGAYFDPSIGFYIPGHCFDATFLNGAKLQKLGVIWKRGATVLTDRARLLHEGPDTPEKLWRDPQYIDCRGIRVGSSKIMRYRPVFHKWATDLEIAFDPDVIALGDVQKTIEDGGALIGVCEMRPRFGRFSHTLKKS